jgi:hypothetical protein
MQRKRRIFVPFEGIETLTGPERDVLSVLAEGTVTRSVVRLSADLYGRKDTDEGFTFGDPIGFSIWVLEHLNAEGYVTYRIPTRAYIEDVPGFAGLPYDIRLTAKGWAVMGHAHYVIEVGTKGTHFREVRGGDPTDYRNHQYIADGGPIERHPWWQCPTLFPPPKPKEASPVTEMNLSPRTYIKVTPEMEERVVNSYARTGSYDKTSAETNVDPRRVRYIVNDRPRLKRDSSSLKERALALIQANGPYVDVMALHRDMPGPHGLHNLVHILHSLHKAQLIDFRLDKSKSSGGNYLNIRARDMSSDTDGTDMSVDATQVGTTNGADTQELAPTSDVGPSSFPELDRLQRLAKETAEGRAKAAQYIAAAENLADVDPEMADRLLAKAADIDGPSLSPVEGEYLAYSLAYPRS